MIQQQTDRTYIDQGLQSLRLEHPSVRQRVLDSPHPAKTKAECFPHALSQHHLTRQYYQRLGAQGTSLVQTASVGKVHHRLTAFAVQKRLQEWSEGHEH